MNKYGIGAADKSSSMSSSRGVGGEQPLLQLNSAISNEDMENYINKEKQSSNILSFLNATDDMSMMF